MRRQDFGTKPGGRPKGRPRHLDDSSIATEALIFLATDQDAAERFFALTGLDAGALRAASAEPGFTAALLDFFVGDDDLLVRFSAAAGWEPEDLALAHDRVRARDAGEA